MPSRRWSARPLSTWLRRSLQRARPCATGAGRPAGCASAFRKTLLLRANYWEAFNQPGVGLAPQGRNEEASENLRRALELEPQSAQCLSNLGPGVSGTGPARWSVEFYRAALTSSSREPTVLTILARPDRSFSLRGGHRLLFARATAIARGSGTHITLGAAYLRAERFQEAAGGKFPTRLARNPQLAEAEKRPRFGAAQSGTHRGGISAFTRALLLQPDDSGRTFPALFTLLHSHEAPLGRFSQSTVNGRKACRPLFFPFQSARELAEPSGASA